MPAMKIYDVFDNGEWIGSYTADAITKLYKVPRRLILAYASSGTKALKRYTFETVTEAEQGTRLKTWAEQWDAARLKLLRVGGRGKNGK